MKNLNDFIIEQLEDNPSWVRKKIVEYLTKTELSREDFINQIDNFVSENKITKNQFYFTCLNILTDFFQYGKYNKILKEKGSIKIDQQELEVGIRFELEHTKDLTVSKRIALDHLVDDSMYYTHLKEMEKKYQQKYNPE